MSVYTQFQFLDQTDPDYLAAKSGSDKKQEEWEDEYGPFNLRPGKPVEGDAICIEETEEEYGGWLIDLSKIPKKATHILVYRS